MLMEQRKDPPRRIADALEAIVDLLTWHVRRAFWIGMATGFVIAYCLIAFLGRK